MDVNKKMYVPDTKKWTMFYTHINRGSVNPYTDHTMKEYQRGGGLRNKTSPYMISIDNYTKRAVEQDTNPKINMTSPAEQEVEQAKSEVKNRKGKTSFEASESEVERQEERTYSKTKKNCKAKVRRFWSVLNHVYFIQ